MFVVEMPSKRFCAMIGADTFIGSCGKLIKCLPSFTSIEERAI